MIALDHLMRINGVKASLNFDSKGTLLQVEGDIPNHLARLLAKLCHANMKIVKSQTEDYTVMGGVGLEHAAGFGVIGSTKTVFTKGNRVILLENDKIDFNEVIKELW